MGKHGPCYHCGVTTTPLWRNGPPEKPVLCNACGSRWRTKGTLANYTPLHSRSEFDDLEEYRTPRAKSMSLNKHKEVKFLKRKQDQDSITVVHDYGQGGLKVIDEDTSNRSSSGSAISNSESCVQFGSADASDLTGPAQSNAWETMVPSKKRTCVNRPKQSSVEKLTKDLCSILHEQSSFFSGSYEEDLLLESEMPMVSVEIGHGSVLIRHPSSIARDEESEASSLSVESKQLTGAHSLSSSLILHNETKYASFPGTAVKAKNPTRQVMQADQVKREKSQQEKPEFLGCHSSLCNIDLRDIVNFEEFVKHLTTEEQHRLLIYLPPLDTAKLPDSLRSMFDSPQFKENLSYFQQLLEEGVFNISSSGLKHEDCKALKRLVLFNSTKSQWVEHHQQLKNSKSSAGGFHVPRGLNAASTSSFVNKKRSHESQSQILSEGKSLKCLKREIHPTSCNKELIESDSSCFSPRPLFAMPPVGSSFMFDSTNFVDESSDQDLLVDVPSNGSFAQAELLHPAISLGGPASTSSSSSYAHLARP